MNKLILIVAYCSIALHILGQPAKRLQLWNKNEVIAQPWKNISIEVAEKIHYSPDRNATDLKYLESFLKHEPAVWFEYGAGFRISKANLYPGWLQENRTMLIANFSKTYHQFNFRYSNRFEFRSFENNFDHFRYRQEFKTEFPALTNWGMRFYTSEETFYKLNGIGFHLFRLYGGLLVVEKKHFALKLYYALEKYKLMESWFTTDIVGINMSFVF
jgi:hypothetical protein